ncbi:MAG: ferredoxin:glutaredoxin reductase [Candidatus Bathyarchaeota archaeon]|nr:ferredoxin:glutaredoxin reductase [Candidatus Bathyarchaeota archaeon]
MTEITIETVLKRAEADARTYGYYLNPDPELLQGLLEGLKVNEERYGYPSCPCRLASGKFEHDRDIICPCDYRDPDVAEFGACYCRLYVSKEVFEGKKEPPTVPERRPLEKQSRAYLATSELKAETVEMQKVLTGKDTAKVVEPKPKLWYCKQCGYVVFRDEPPYICPICKAKREMFAEIKTLIEFVV